jgi:hypothetical protein
MRNLPKAIIHVLRQFYSGLLGIGLRLYQGASGWGHLGPSQQTVTAALLVPDLSTKPRLQKY